MIWRGPMVMGALEQVRTPMSLATKRDTRTQPA
jgi:hypothetical protein